MDFTFRHKCYKELEEAPMKSAHFPLISRISMTNPKTKLTSADLMAQFRYESDWPAQSELRAGIDEQLKKTPKNIRPLANHVRSSACERMLKGSRRDRRLYRV